MSEMKTLSSEDKNSTSPEKKAKNTGLSEERETNERFPSPEGSQQPSADPAAGQKPGHYVVAEEYTVGVPLVRPKKDFLEILRAAGATGEVFTRKEICLYLKDYIGARKMYDEYDPRIVYCENDPLGKLFGVRKFTIEDVVNLLNQHCTQTPDTCIKRKRHLVNKPLPAWVANPPSFDEVDGMSSSNSVTIAVCHAPSLVSHSSTTHTAGRTSPKKDDDDVVTFPPRPQENVGKRKRQHKNSSSESSGPSRKRHASLSITYSDTEGSSNYPWYFRVKLTSDDESEVLSVQTKDTVPVEDSSDDMWFLDESSLSTEMLDTDSISVASGEGFLVVCKDSDVEFWADSSDSETDTELTEADKWKCKECDTKNIPLQRYCVRCWKLRPDWLPDKLKATESKRRKIDIATAVKTSSTDSDGGVILSSEYLPDSARKQDVFNKGDHSEGTVPPSFLYSSVNESVDSGICSTQASSQEVLSSSQEKIQADIDKVASAVSGGQKKLDEMKTGQAEVRHTFSNFQVLNRRGSTQSTGSHSSKSKKPKKPRWKKQKSEHPSVDASSTPKVPSQFAAIADPCITCLSNPKTASIIHGSSGHQVCCLSCAKNLKKRGQPCPYCRLPIQKVVKNYIL